MNVPAATPSHRTPFPQTLLFKGATDLSNGTIWGVATAKFDKMTISIAHRSSRLTKDRGQDPPSTLCTLYASGEANGDSAE